jgi:hypothetical protein
LATKDVVALWLDIEQGDEAGDTGGGVTAGHGRLRKAICGRGEAVPRHKISKLRRKRA